jgi:hypothetical protein
MDGDRHRLKPVPVDIEAIAFTSTCYYPSQPHWSNIFLENSVNPIPPKTAFPVYSLFIAYTRGKAIGKSCVSIENQLIMGNLKATNPVYHEQP